jgi:hypothetical protein
MDYFVWAQIVILVILLGVAFKVIKEDHGYRRPKRD